MDAASAHPQPSAHPGFEMPLSISTDMQQQQFQHQHPSQQPSQQQDAQQQQSHSSLASPVTARPMGSATPVQQNLVQQSYSTLPSPVQPQANVQQPMQAMQFDSQQQPQQQQQQQQHAQSMGQQQQAEQQMQHQQNNQQAPSQAQLMSMHASQPGHAEHAPTMSQAAAPMPSSSMADAAAINGVYAQRPIMTAHQRSLSLGVHMHQMASQSMPQHSIPASAESLQSFGWPSAPSQNELLMSATPAQPNERFAPTHHRAASHSMAHNPGLGMQTLAMNMQAVPVSPFDMTHAQAQSNAQAQAQMQAQAQAQAQAHAQAQATTQAQVHAQAQAQAQLQAHAQMQAQVQAQARAQAQAQVQAQLQAQAQMQAQAQQAQADAQAAAIRAASASTQQPSSEHAELMNQIAKLLDDVVLQAKSARESFHNGDGMNSNRCLGDLQKDLQHIQHLSHQKFAPSAPASMPALPPSVQSSQPFAAPSIPSAASTQPQPAPLQGLAPPLSLEQRTPSQQQQQTQQPQQQHSQPQQQQDVQPLPNLTLSQMKGADSDMFQSGEVSPIARKRPVQSDSDLIEQPFKSLRSETATPINPPQPPPSAPPAAMSAATGSSLMQAPMPSQSAPPSERTNGVNLGQPHNLLAQATAALPNGVQSLHASPSTPQTPFEFPPGQGLAILSNGDAMAQSIPSSPAIRQEGHMRGGSLHDAMTMTPQHGQKQMSAGLDFPNSAERGQSKMARSALQMSAISSSNTSANQSALDSGASSPEESFSNGDSGDEGAQAGDASQAHLTKHRRHRSSGFFSSGASFDFGAPDDSGVGDASMAGTDKNAPAAALSPELRSKLETIFYSFLTAVCSDLEITDDRGELLHQTLMPKKMARLDESPDFRPFKFRIQAFTNAFQAEVYRNGITEAECSIKKIKQFLWTQPYISRFNEDGKKAKSKGNHIWIVEAKKIPEGGWEFREFSRKIAGAPEKIAYVGLKWTWPLKVWDPQASSTSIKAVFSCDKVPSWLQWEENNRVLSGTPTAGSESGEVSVTAHYVHGGQLHQLQHSFYLQVASIAADELQANDAGPSAGSTALAAQLATVNGAGGRVAPAVMAAAPVAPDMLSQEMQAGLLPPGHAFINGQPPANFPSESINHQIVEPAKVPAVLNAISFPFTPPVHADARPQYFQSLSNEAAMLTPQLSEVANAVPEALRSTSQLSSAMASPMPPQMMHSPFQNAPAHQLAAPQTLQAPASSQALQQQMQANVALPPQSAPMVASQPEGQQPNGGKASSEEIQVHQVRSMIERKQQAQAANFMLSIPSRKAAIAAEAARPVSGQTTPMSSMPTDMAAHLPALSSLPPNESLASGMPPNAIKNDAMLSPALNVGFDALGQAGMQLGMPGDQTNPNQQG